MEFKREYSFGLVKTIAAMADTYGGMILVGIDDRPGRVSSGASTRLGGGRGFDLDRAGRVTRVSAET
ncbi:ATP-binding protein, partial [Streptomyces sp. NPDC003006]